MIKSSLADEGWCQQCGVEISPGNSLCATCQVESGKSPIPAVILPESGQRMIDRPWVLVVLILHLGLLGIPLYWRTRHSLFIRLGMVIGSIVYTVIAVLIIYWGIRQVLRAAM